MGIKFLQAAAVAAFVLLPTVTVVGGEQVAYAQGSDADKAKAKAAYKQGTIKYNLGEWNAAIKFFKKAFEAYPDASFLFNIAQSYRQSDDCKQSAFFYKRYLAIKPDASNKREVEGFIVELDETCKKRKAGEVTPPPKKDPIDTDIKPDPEPKPDPDPIAFRDTKTDPKTEGTEVAEVDLGGGTTGELTENASGGGDSVESTNVPKLVLAYAGIGSAILSIGDLETSPQLNVTIGGGYPLQMGSIMLSAGAMISYTSVQWDAGGDINGTAGLTALLVNVGAGMEVASKIRVRGEVGAGMMVYTGLSVPGNVFVDRGTAADAPLSSVSFRTALGGEYAITDNISVSAQPLILTVSPAPEGMRRSIESIKSYQALVGLGYRM